MPCGRMAAIGHYGRVIQLRRFQHSRLAHAATCAKHVNHNSDGGDSTPFAPWQHCRPALPALPTPAR